VENRRVNNDYTILFETKIFQIARKDICAVCVAPLSVEKKRRRWIGRGAFPRTVSQR